MIELTYYDLLTSGTISVTIPNGTVISGKVYSELLETPIDQSPNVIYDYLETYRRARDQAQSEEAVGELRNE